MAKSNGIGCNSYNNTANAPDPILFVEPPGIEPGSDDRTSSLLRA